MTLSKSEVRLQRVTKLNSKTRALLAEGIRLEADLARPLSDAMDQTVADRLALSDEFLAMGHALVRSRHDLSRAAIARYYYAMYHAMRAAAYQYFEGDDHEAHSALSSKGVPADYPSQALARNQLNDARILRNEADYEQYPADPKYFKSQARALRANADAFVKNARSYVQSKGNPHA